MLASAACRIASLRFDAFAIGVGTGSGGAVKPAAGAGPPDTRGVLVDFLFSGPLRGSEDGCGRFFELGVSHGWSGTEESLISRKRPPWQR